MNESSLVAVDFFDRLNNLYGGLVSVCTPDSCPVMSAGPKYVDCTASRFAQLDRYEFLWADGEKIKKPIKVSAPVYIDYLMTWVEGILDDSSIFPTEINMPYPKNFRTILSNIYKRLFRYVSLVFSSTLIVGYSGTCTITISPKSSPTIKSLI